MRRSETVVIHVREADSPPSQVRAWRRLWQLLLADAPEHRDTPGGEEATSDRRTSVIAGQRNPHGNDRRTGDSEGRQ
jgi:hypothetical protein